MSKSTHTDADGSVCPLTGITRTGDYNFEQLRQAVRHLTLAEINLECILLVSGTDAIKVPNDMPEELADIYRELEKLSTRLTDLRNKQELKREKKMLGIVG